MNESQIDKYSKTLEHLETRSRAHQQDEITNSLIQLITSCEDSIGNKSFFCTTFRIFHDTKVRKLSSNNDNLKMFMIIFFVRLYRISSRVYRPDSLV